MTEKQLKFLFTKCVVCKLISRFASCAGCVAVCAVISLQGTFAQAWGASDLSAQISRQLDTVQNLKLDTTLPQAIQQIGVQTGVRLEADPSIWEILPWGEQTTIKANIQNHTLRQGLTAITQRLGLEFFLESETVRLMPCAALRRTGQRATLEQLDVIGLLQTTPLKLDQPTAKQLVQAVNQKLVESKSMFVVDDQMDEVTQKQVLHVTDNATLANLLDEIRSQTNCTWYPGSKTIIVVSKQAHTKKMLEKTLTAHYTGVDVGQVLLELFQHAGVDFTVDPGAYYKIPVQARSIQLLLDNASIAQALESISGYTGLAFTLTDQGIVVSYRGDITPSNPKSK